MTLSEFPLPSIIPSLSLPTILQSKSNRVYLVTNNTRYLTPNTTRVVQ
jgi:hypothetical protein